MLTKNQRTHTIILKDWRVFNITESQSELYESEITIKKHNELITINDIDTDEILFKWRCAEIKEFWIRKTDSSYGTSNAVCEFWTRHPISWYPDNCTCAKDFDCLCFNIQDWLREQGYKINYASDIDSKMQQEFRNR